MQSNKKESFKLLQLSDDSKTLSDLELPELPNQRKRKVRRKTRNTSPLSRHGGGSGSGSHSKSSHHHQQDTDSIAGACHNFSLWIAIFMSCGWLFILSYMTAVVYTENRRLEVQINKVSASSQNVPDELQKWHETSKYVEQNQTNIYNKISDIEHRLDAVEKELKLLQVQVNKKNDDSSDHGKVVILQTSVANLGAKIQDITVDMGSMKDHVLLLENNTKENITKLQQYVNNNNNSAELSQSSTQSALTVNNGSEIVRNMTELFKHDLKIVRNDLILANDTLSQRIKGLDDELRHHKTDLDNLKENMANITSHVTSIELEKFEPNPPKPNPTTAAAAAKQVPDVIVPEVVPATVPTASTVVAANTMPTAAPVIPRTKSAGIESTR